MFSLSCLLACFCYPTFFCSFLLVLWKLININYDFFLFTPQTYFAVLSLLDHYAKITKFFCCKKKSQPVVYTTCYQHINILLNQWHTKHHYQTCITAPCSLWTKPYFEIKTKHKHTGSFLFATVVNNGGLNCVQANGLACTGKYVAGSIPSFAANTSLFVKQHAY